MKVALEVTSPKEAKSRSVAVVADAYMEDPVEADKLAELMRGQLTVNGFKVQETENEAELVVISTIERSKPTSTGTAPLPRAWRSFDLSYGLGRGQHDGIAERLAESGIRIRICGTGARAVEGGADGHSGHPGSLV